MVLRSYLGMGQFAVFHIELYIIAVTCWKSVGRAGALQAHPVTTDAALNDLLAAMWWRAYLDLGPEQRLAKAINRYAKALHTHRIEAAIHWGLGYSGIPRNNQADGQAIMTQEDQGYWYTFGNGYWFRVTRYHMMIISGGDGITFINYMPAP
jgi:hypothetical protein